MMSNPAIVVIAYNRVEPLKRLLHSIASANYPANDITLHISIDASTNMDVKAVADHFEWKHGNKVVDLKDERRGLLKHVLECGHLTSTYGSIIVLEDDLIVAPGFYNYASEAEKFYSEDIKIAGVSLYTYPVEENNFYPFEPIKDDSDVHFIQVASSWGQSWNNKQWTRFISWLTDFPNGKPELLPKYIQEWGENSWKRLFINYMIDTDRYFVFPNISLSSNFEEKGTHANNTGLFQVKLNAGITNYRFEKIDKSVSIYDVYFELLPQCIKQLCPEFVDYSFDVDLYGVKPIHSSKEFILTTRRSKNSIKSFGTKMKPLIQNVFYGIKGESIVLCKKDDLLESINNRFLKLHTPAGRLEQLTQLTYQQLTLIVPVLDTEISELSKTISNLETKSFFDAKLLIVCSTKIESEVRKLAIQAPLEFEVIPGSDQTLDSLLFAGLLSCTTDYCGWLRPGMFVDLNKINEVVKIFQSFRQVQILQGVQEEIDEASYLKLNTSWFRWTPRRVTSNPSKSKNIRSEFVFWRTSIVKGDTITQMRSNTLFFELIKLNPIYVVALKFGDYNNVQPHYSDNVRNAQDILNVSEHRTKNVLRLLLSPLFQYWFNKNIPIFRFLYKEMEQLPFVIRYDFKNDSYYLSNY